MTATTIPAPAGPAPQSSARPSLSLESLQKSRRARALLGILLTALVVGLSYLIVLAFTGHFTNVVRINAQLPAGSNAVPLEAPVEYRNVTVGKVGSETAGPGGVVAVQFLIYPSKLVQIPAGVQAQVSPLSLFGNQFVDLVPPATISPGHLEAGQFVRPFAGTPSTSLQGTVTQLHNLLNALHPADLDTALTAFATALNGEGTSLGHALAGTSDYLGTAVTPNLGNVQSDLRQLVPFSQTLNSSAPDLLGTLSNSSVTAQTLTSEQATLHTLLTSGTSAVGRFGGILQAVQTTLPSLIDESGPLLADVTRNPNELSQTLSGLTAFASALAAHETAGPFITVTANLPVTNISAGVNAALGYNNPASVTAALSPNVNPPTYTSANCPQYPGTSNPYCGSGGSPAATPAGPQSVAVSAASAGKASTGAGAPAPTAGTMSAERDPGAPPSADQLAAIDSIASALSGGPAPASPATAELMLYPLLSSLAGSQ